MEDGEMCTAADSSKTFAEHVETSVTGTILL